MSEDYATMQDLSTRLKDKRKAAHRRVVMMKSILDEMRSLQDEMSALKD